MSNAELESLIIAYLEGSASRDQVVRLRNAIQSSADLRERFYARVRLHKAQLEFLRSRADLDAIQAASVLTLFAQRAGRVFAHVCVLALVFVQLRVTLPAEYSGLMLYVEDALAEDRVEEVTLPGQAAIPLLALADLSSDDMPDMSMALPPLTLPEMVQAVEDPSLNEA